MTGSGMQRRGWWEGGSRVGVQCRDGVGTEEITQVTAGRDSGSYLALTNSEVDP